MSFKYFDHTADVMFEGYGKTLEEAFGSAALAMFNLLTDIEKVKAAKKYKLGIIADTKEKLLFDFLDELLFYLDTEHIIFSKFEDMKIAKKNNLYFFECTALGDLASNYRTHGDVKAPTYNEMLIKEEKGKFSVRVVVDI
ncbi:TPA: archease [Candidatus Woesearchaeota archaeon]|nr:Protein archease [archaeon GW2011_AR15]MBS3104334.1 archease [Candidatus Woesearchaeota archaeon]HIH40882.1 archease [Candidatus Woesearchaeota archaeon]